MHWGDFAAEKMRALGGLCLGVDPVPADMPFVYREMKGGPAAGLRVYVEDMLAASAGKVGFVKFQAAFFEAYGVEGVRVLAGCMTSARQVGMGVILDAKRGDIGSTAGAYARAYLAPASAGGSDLEADCLTVNPFMGPDTLEPFVDFARSAGKGVFVLTKTSNPGAAWMQDVTTGDGSISDRVAALVASLSLETKGASGLGAVGAVVGATNAADAVRLRAAMPDAIILAPGMGAQGGSADTIRQLGRPANAKGGRNGVVMPVSRGISKIDDLGVTPEGFRRHVTLRIADFAAQIA